MSVVPFSSSFFRAAQKTFHEHLPTNTQPEQQTCVFIAIQDALSGRIEVHSAHSISQPQDCAFGISALVGSGTCKQVEQINEGTGWNQND